MRKTLLEISRLAEDAIYDCSWKIGRVKVVKSFLQYCCKTDKAADVTTEVIFLAMKLFYRLNERHKFDGCVEFTLILPTYEFLCCLGKRIIA